MATMVTISDEAKSYADDLVRLGRYASLDEAIEAGVLRLKIDGDHEDIPPEHWAAIEEGLADIEAGRVHDAEEVFDRLRERYRNWPA